MKELGATTKLPRILNVNEIWKRTIVYGKFIQFISLVYRYFELHIDDMMMYRSKKGRTINK